MNQKSPLVSVIVPNYNHAQYLEQRLDTIFNQTYQNFEVIILDDNSTDSSLEVINRYKDNPHLSQVVVNKQNSGSPFKQWEKGIALAKGELIWIAESDDYCELNMLEELVKAYYMRKNTVLAYNPTQLRGDDGVIWNRQYVGQNQYISGKRYLRTYFTLFNWVMNASCAIFSKEAALHVRDYYKSYKGAGDYLFWVEIVEQGNVAIVNKPLSYFCRHAGTVTNKREIDGTNPLECKKINAYISSKIHISKWREHLIYAYHRQWFGHSNYETKEIAEKVAKVWHFSEYNSLLDNFILRAAQYLRKHFNYYV